MKRRKQSQLIILEHQWMHLFVWLPEWSSVWKDGSRNLTITVENCSNMQKILKNQSMCRTRPDYFIEASQIIFCDHFCFIYPKERRNVNLRAVSCHVAQWPLVSAPLLQWLERRRRRRIWWRWWRRRQRSYCLILTIWTWMHYCASPVTHWRLCANASIRHHWCISWVCEVTSFSGFTDNTLLHLFLVYFYLIKSESCSYVVFTLAKFQWNFACK